MNERASFRRYLLILAYALTTVLAQGTHRHGPSPEEETSCLASCQDSRLHFSGHSAPDLEHHPHDCLACHFRTSHQGGPLSTCVLWLETVGEKTPVPPSVAAPRDRSVRPSCRAPPRSLVA
ncbi:MAG: hypothetical protein ABI353_14020 [Isosphaeraceae bacterium]